MSPSSSPSEDNMFANKKKAKLKAHAGVQKMNLWFIYPFDPSNLLKELS